MQDHLFRVSHVYICFTVKKLNGMFSHGTYLVNSTITIPAGTQITGEAWSQIMGYGSNFQSPTNPQVVVRVGDRGSTGVVEVCLTSLVT
jgi:hypothetical protein